MKTEQGRSLIELLGVIAIIVALTVGALKGYRVAVLRNNANLIEDDILLKSVALNALPRSIFSQLTNTPFTNMGITSTLPEDVTFSFTNTGTTFTLTYSNIPKDLCNTLLRLDFSDRFFSGMTGNTTCPNTSNTLNYTFLFAGGPTSSGTDSSTLSSATPSCSNGGIQCSGCQTCSNGACTDVSSNADLISKCGSSCFYCVAGSCLLQSSGNRKTNCSKTGGITNDGTCDVTGNCR